MAGNTVKGKIFKDEHLAYSKTGIARGNPKRYASSSVLRTTRRDGRGPPGTLVVEVEEKIETEGDRQLKALAKRQLDTQVTLKSQLQRKRDFTEATLYKPLGAEASGELSLSDYRQLSETDSRIDELRHCGLSDHEIALKLGIKIQREHVPTKQRKYVAEPSNMEAQMDAIEDKISKKKEDLAKPTSFRDKHHMTRHERELEASISHDVEKAKLLSCLMSTVAKETDFDDPKHPINHLDSMMENILQKQQVVKIETPEPSKYECCEKCDSYKREQATKPLVDAKGRLYVPADTTSEKRTENLPEYDDVAELVPFGPQPLQKFQCNADCSFTLIDDVESTPEEDIVQHRLSMEQIRELPRFHNYEAGEPNKTLFIKNLSQKATPENLVSLFIRFQKPDLPKVVFKLMSGRMKGQAFVTFDSEDTATQALSLVNGYDLRGKPLIIQYGRKKNEKT